MQLHSWVTYILYPSITVVVHRVYPSTLAWLLLLLFSMLSIGWCLSSSWYPFASTHTEDPVRQQKRLLSHLFEQMLWLLSVLQCYLDLVGALDWQLVVVHPEKPPSCYSFFLRSLWAFRDYWSLFSMAFERRKLEMSGKNGCPQLPARHMDFTVALQSRLQLHHLSSRASLMSPILQVQPTNQKQGRYPVRHLLKCTLKLVGIHLLQMPNFALPCVTWKHACNFFTCSFCSSTHVATCVVQTYLRILWAMAEL